MSALAVSPISAELLVHFVGAEVQLFYFPMLRADFMHPYLAVMFNYISREDAVAVWAYALSASN